jgi:murein L,D-transpeptidase YafK
MRRLLASFAAALALVLVVLIVWDRTRPARYTPELATAADRATSILMEKQARRLTLFRGDQAIKSYRVALGGNPLGTKEHEGDSRTPEGDYTIDSKNPRSHFHLALHISYPDAEDRAHAAAHDVSPGGDIMIHGLPNGLGWLGSLLLRRDWTDGCIAVTDAEIEEIWTLVDTGTPIRIEP